MAIICLYHINGSPGIGIETLIWTLVIINSIYDRLEA